MPSTYKPFPRQQEFHRNPAKYRLFGGAAGPGKSRALLEETCMQAWETPGADTLLLRRSFKELDKSIISQFRRHILPQWEEVGARYLESDKMVYWPNGSKTYFGYSDSEKDIYQYQGGEFLFIGVDELTTFTLKQWQFLTSRNRCPVPGSVPCMAGATNPGNIGHGWVKALWVDKEAPAEMEDPSTYNPNDYAFIKALIWDNPVYANDDSYINSLKSLPPYMRQMFLDGEWNLHIGTYFDVFNPEIQVVSGIELKPWYSRWVSIDWGFAHDSAIYWHVSLPDGRTLTYREFVANQLTPKDLAKELSDRTGNDVIEAIYLSPDAYARRDSPDTVAIQLNNELELVGLPRAMKADNDRVGGWSLMYQMLKTVSWVIDRSCVRLIKCLPSLTRDEKFPEDVLKVDGDDPADSARYGLKSRLGAAQMPLADRVAERVKHLSYTDKQHFIPRVMREEMRKTANQPFSFKGVR